jgi:hypothetical protein
VQAANHLAAAPATAPVKPPTALDVIPTQWLPYGHSERNFEGRALGLGFTEGIKVMGGKAQIDRDHDKVSVKTPNGDFTSTPDAAHAGGVTAKTPDGVFSGKLEKKSDSRYEFKSTDGKHGLSIEKTNKGVRFDTHGFGVLDAAHLNVLDH